MQNILEDLYCGNICPAERPWPRSHEYRHVQRCCVELGERLMEPMNERQRKLFLDYEEQISARCSIDCGQSFAEGFSLAVRLLAAALAERKAE